MSLEDEFMAYLDFLNDYWDFFGEPPPSAPKPAFTISLL